MKTLVAALLVANLAFLAWTQGWLDAVVGVSPLGDREPARLQRQLHRERLRVVDGRTEATPPAGRNAAAPADAAPGDSADAGCFEAGPFSPTELIAAEAALVRAALPAGSWTDLRIDRPGSWIVYVGRFATREQLAQKQDELRRRQLPFEEVRNAPDLEFGLSLGRFDERAAADSALTEGQQRGVRNARVLAVAAPSTVHLLRIERADATLQGQLGTLRAPALGAGFVRCGQAAVR